MVGWPPVRSVRKKALKSCKYVKVAVDGAPYLRKVDLEVHRSYEQLLMALETMFDCFTVHCKHFFSSIFIVPKKHEPQNRIKMILTKFGLIIYFKLSNGRIFFIGEKTPKISDDYYFLKLELSFCCMYKIFA